MPNLSYDLAGLLSAGQLLQQAQNDLVTDFSTTNTVSPGDAMCTINMTIRSALSRVRLDGQCLGINTGSNTNECCLCVDGVLVAFSRTGIGNTLLVQQVFCWVTGLSPGAHVFTWRAFVSAGTFNVAAATNPGTRRSSLAVAEWSPPP